MYIRPCAVCTRSCWQLCHRLYAVLSTTQPIREKWKREWSCENECCFATVDGVHALQVPPSAGHDRFHTLDRRGFWISAEVFTTPVSVRTGLHPIVGICSRDPRRYARVFAFATNNRSEIESRLHCIFCLIPLTPPSCLPITVCEVNDKPFAYYRHVLLSLSYVPSGDVCGWDFFGVDRS